MSFSEKTIGEDRFSTAWTSHASQHVHIEITKTDLRQV